MKREMTISFRKTGIAGILLFVIVLTVYGNTFDAAWHMDDLPHITQNPAIQIEDLRPITIVQTFFAHPVSKERLYRPVAGVTFALNWFLGKGNVTGYRLTNIIIHTLTALLLYLTILNLFNSPRLCASYRGSEYFIALLAACLWVVHPMQTQAVTYIVQRMALLAAFFYLLGIYFFIKARLNAWVRSPAWLYAGCLISFMLALGSKENAVIFPIALLLVELVFFQDLSLLKTRKKTAKALTLAAAAVVLIAVFVVVQKNEFSILRGYQHRSFTLTERILTEPRIIVYYLSQLILPLPDRFSFQRDIELSTSWLTPWTTLPAILLIGLLLYFVFSQVNKRPILTFGILFFFLNHVVESTILPLELYFEHRNYLPSLFLFWPLATGCWRLVDYCRRNQHAIARVGLIVGLILLMVGLGYSSSVRNSVWATEESLWEDVRRKAPGLARPHQVIAAQYMRSGQFESALELYKKALTLKHPSPRVSQAHSLNNMGNIYLHQDEYAKALKFFVKAQNIFPGHEKSLHNMALVHIQCGRWDDALRITDRLLAKHPGHIVYLNLKGFILNKQMRPLEAKTYLLRAMGMAPNDRNTAVNLGMALSLAGHYGQGEHLLQRAKQFYPRDITIHMSLVENSLRANDTRGAAEHVDKSLAEFGVNGIIHYLKEIITDYHTTPLSADIIVPAVCGALKKKSVQLKTLCLLENTYK